MAVLFFYGESKIITKESKRKTQKVNRPLHHAKRLKSGDAVVMLHLCYIQQIKIG